MKVAEKKHTLKGFTIAEVLVTLVLTSIVITLSYTTLGYVRKLFYDYKAQNLFISQYTNLKNCLAYEALKCDRVAEDSDNTFSLTRDSITTTLQITTTCIVLKRKELADTFFIVAKNIKKEYELMKSPQWANRLIKSIQFETGFTKQNFNFCFYKNHDASVKMELDKEQ